MMFILHIVLKYDIILLMNCVKSSINFGRIGIIIKLILVTLVYSSFGSGLTLAGWV